jgi:hypothetical protein
MRAVQLALVSGLFAGISALPAVCVAEESATTSVAVTAQFSSRTSLKVSSQLLQFAVTAPGEAALATMEFSAAARTRPAGEVVLTVEAVREIDGPGGAADIETAVTFSGEGEGTAAGALGTAAPSVAGRWSGSGLRTGRLTFALRSAVTGSYSVPLRFVLSTP